MISSLMRKNIIPARNRTRYFEFAYNGMCPYKRKAVIICTQTATNATYALKVQQVQIVLATAYPLPNAQGKSGSATFQDL